MIEHYFAVQIFYSRHDVLNPKKCTSSNERLNERIDIVAVVVKVKRRASCCRNIENFHEWFCAVMSSAHTNTIFIKYLRNIVRVDVGERK